MPFDPLQERYLERFFPGLIEAVRDLGPGDFEPIRPRFGVLGTDIINDVKLHLAYRLTDNHSVKIRISLHARPTAPPYKPSPSDGQVNIAHWERYHYMLHYGLTREDERLFQIDLEDPWGYHVHMRPDVTKHVPLAEVDPDVRDLDLLEFVKMVKAYRSDKKNYPLWKKKP